MSREAMQLALEALESDPISHAGLVSRKQAITALRQALETEQEPVAWLSTDCIGERYLCFTKPKDNDPVQPLYTAPPKHDYVIDCPRCGHCCQALEEKQEPFEYWSVAGGWVKLDEMREHFEIAGCGTIYKSAGEGRSPLYTTPPKREWVGLTAYEIQEIHSGNQHWGNFACAIEAKLKEKNT